MKKWLLLWEGPAGQLRKVPVERALHEAARVRYRKILVPHRCGSDVGHPPLAVGSYVPLSATGIILAGGEDTCAYFG